MKRARRISAMSVTAASLVVASGMSPLRAQTTPPTPSQTAPLTPTPLTPTPGMSAPGMSAPGTPGLSAPSPAPPVSDPASVLADGRATQSQRDEAASRLLARQTLAARQILRDELISPDTDGQLAVAHALEQDPEPDPSFIDPLFPLLLNGKTAVAAGHALSGYKGNPEVLTRLIDTAQGRRNTPDFTRTAAIRAIGTMPERRAAATLIDLLGSPDESAIIHNAAADALVDMTGLDQNGRDPARWAAWWAGEQNTSDAAFRQQIDSRQEARLDRLESHLQTLDAEIKSLLRDEYHAAAPDQKPALAMRFLKSPVPEVREIGTGVISDGIIDGLAPTPSELARLRDMVADSSPAVRRAVADTISKLNDPASLDALLAQLKVEPDPSVRAAIATALGPMHDLRALPTLVQLLGDPSIPTAEAAAGAIQELAHGPLADKQQESAATAASLLATINGRLNRPGNEDLIARCIEAIAPLRQPDVVRQLQDDKLMNRGGKEIRRAMVRAVGDLRDPQSVDFIVNALNDQDDDVAVQAIQSLAINPAAPAYAQSVGDLLRPDAARSGVVRDTAWDFMKGIFSHLKLEQLSNLWVDRFSGQRKIVVLQAMADKLKAAGKMDDLARIDMQTGDAYLQVHQNADAADSFKKALDIYNVQQVPVGMQAQFVELEQSYLRALLDDGNFAKAVDFAAGRIAADTHEQGNMGPVIAEKVEELSSSNVAAAKQLVDLVSKMNPPLAGHSRERIESVAAGFPKKTSNSDGGMDRESASAAR